MQLGQLASLLHVQTIGVFVEQSYLRTRLFKGAALLSLVELIVSTVCLCYTFGYRIVFLNLYSAAHGKDHLVALPVRRPRE